MSEVPQSVIAISMPEADQVLSCVRSRYEGEMPPAGAPAHITLLYPWMPPAHIGAAEMAGLASLFADFPCFDFRLELGWFGHEVLLLVPEDPSPFVALTEAVISRWPMFPYYCGDHDKIEPHVTLAYGDLSALAPIAAELSGLLPVRGRVTSACLSAGQPGLMSTQGSFALGCH
jgi:hypothetical protein